MRLTVNLKNYKVKFNLLSRLKMRKYGGESVIIEKAYKGDRIALYQFIYCCIDFGDDKVTFERYIDSYPNLNEMDIALVGMFSRLVNEATNPYELKINTEKKKETAEREDTTDEEFKELITSLMSKGYSYKVVLDMTYWDINMVLESDYKRLEREVFHTNAIINSMVACVGGKNRNIDILGRAQKEKEKELTHYNDISAAIRKAKEGKNGKGK